MLALRLDGGRWTVQPTPDDGRYQQGYGVSCFPATGCTAVGQVRPPYRSLALGWDGTQWSQQAIH